MLGRQLSLCTCGLTTTGRSFAVLSGHLIGTTFIATLICMVGLALCELLRTLRVTQRIMRTNGGRRRKPSLASKRISLTGSIHSSIGALAFRCECLNRPFVQFSFLIYIFPIFYFYFYFPIFFFFLFSFEFHSSSLLKSSFLFSSLIFLFPSNSFLLFFFSFFLS